MTTKLRMTLLAAFLGATTMTAQAGVLTLDGVTFTSSWSGNVLTLEIDAARRSGGWTGATGLAALAIKDVGAYSSVSVGAAPGGTTAWKLSSSELKASGCAGTSNGAAGSRLCFYGQQIALDDDMVFKFAFNGTGVTTREPHVKVEFVDAKGNKVGSLLSQTLPAATTSTAPTGTATATTAATTTTVPVASVPAAAPGNAPADTIDATSLTDTLATVDVALGDEAFVPSAAPATLPPTHDLAPTVPVGAAGVEPAAIDAGAGTAAVPEPETLALLAGGLALMGLVLRRRGARTR